MMRRPPRIESSVLRVVPGPRLADAISKATPPFRGGCQSLKKFAKSSLSLLLIQSGLMGKPSILLEPSGTERNVMSLLTNTKGSLKVLLTRRSLTNTCFTTLLMCPLQSNQFCTSQAPTTKNKALCKKQWMCIFIPAKS